MWRGATDYLLKGRVIALCHDMLLFASSIVCLEHRGRFARPPRSGRDRESGAPPRLVSHVSCVGMFLAKVVLALTCVWVSVSYSRLGSRRLGTGTSVRVVHHKPKRSESEVKVAPRLPPLHVKSTGCP